MDLRWVWLDRGWKRKRFDVNFAARFPLLNRMFGTYYLPDDERWPNEDGIGAGDPLPKG